MDGGPREIFEFIHCGKAAQLKHIDVLLP